MKRAVICLLLTLVWLAVTGSVSVANILLGLAVGWLSAWLVRHETPPSLPKVRPLALLLLGCLFFRELVLSVYRVAVIVLRPRMHLNPGVIVYPLTLTRDFEIALLANLITLTPGTLTVDVSEDRRTLTFHALDGSDPEAARRDIRDGFERHIRKAFPL